jgi:hypothetical protein
MWERFQRAES